LYLIESYYLLNLITYYLLFSGEPPFMKMNELLEYLNSYQKILGLHMCLFTYRSGEVECAKRNLVTSLHVL